MTVSIGKVGSAAGAANYFASDNYYTHDQAEGASLWAGDGAREAGLSGKVDTETFEAVLNGTLPDGTQVGQQDKRDHGRDFTFSAPKSMSLLALVSGDRRLVDLHNRALLKTMQWAEKNLAEARIKVDGKDVAVRTGNLVYAMFQHDTSRATDPQLHGHAVIANMTRLPEKFRNPDRIDPETGEVIKDDGWRAWHNGNMYKASALLTSMYRAELRKGAAELGYRTELTPGGKHGEFELVGPRGERINKEALDGFSKRSADIREKAAELGIKSAAGRREVTARTRDAKVDAGDRGELVDRWRDEAREYGYNGDAIAIAAREHAASRGARPRGMAAVSAMIQDAIARVGQWLERPSDPMIDPDLLQDGLCAL